MNILYDSEHFSVLAYPSFQGLELVDKDSRRMRFLHGAEAWSFRAAINDIPEAARDVETIDAFLDDYCNGASTPIVFH